MMDVLLWWVTRTTVNLWTFKQDNLGGTELIGVYYYQLWLWLGGCVKLLSVNLILLCLPIQYASYYKSLRRVRVRILE